MKTQKDRILELFLILGSIAVLGLLLTSCKGGRPNDTKGGPHNDPPPKSGGNNNQNQGNPTSCVGTWQVVKLHVIAATNKNTRQEWPTVGTTITFDKNSLSRIGNETVSREIIERGLGSKLSIYRNHGTGKSCILEFSWSVMNHPVYCDIQHDMYSFGLDEKTGQIYGQYTSLFHINYNSPQDIYRSEFWLKPRGAYGSFIRNLGHNRGNNRLLLISNRHRENPSKEQD